MISVMMPVYNAGEFLKETIESVLQQTMGDFEFLIINDGSTDNSEDIILSYKDPRIRYIKKENGGESSARNLAIEQAKGEYIVFQDADDVSLPQRFEMLRRHFWSENIGYVHSDMLLINEQGTPLGYWQSRQMERASVTRFFLKTGTPFNNPSMMVRKDVFAGYRYDTAYKIGPDSDMVSWFAPKWEGIHVPEPLLLYRRHSNNITKQIKDYEQIFGHVRKFIQRHSLKQLLPELEWEKGDQEPKAKAILALFLARRGMTHDAQTYFAEAEKQASPEEARFVKGLVHLAMKEPQKTLAAFLGLPKDAVIENYIGEAKAMLGNSEGAKESFIKSLSLQPNYPEPHDNLRAIGGAKGLNLLDATWQKFLGR